MGYYCRFVLYVVALDYEGADIGEIFLQFVAGVIIVGQGEDQTVVHVH